MKKMILIACVITSFLQAQNGLEGPQRPSTAPSPDKFPSQKAKLSWLSFAAKIRRRRPKSAPAKSSEKEPSRQSIRELVKASPKVRRRRRSSVVPIAVFEREEAEREKRAKDKAKKKRLPSESSGDERGSVSPGAVLVRVKPKRGQSISVNVEVGDDGKAETKKQDAAALLGSAEGKLETAEAAAEESEESDCGAKCCGCFKGLLALICIL